MHLPPREIRSSFYTNPKCRLHPDLFRNIPGCFLMMAYLGIVIRCIFLARNRVAPCCHLPRGSAPGTARRGLRPGLAWLFAAVAVVGEDAGGGVVHVAALPVPVGHPEPGDHLGLAGIIFLKQLPVQEGFLGKGAGVVVLPALLLEFLIGIPALGVLLRSSTWSGPPRRKTPPSPA